MTRRIAIIGGGISGVAAAYEIAKNDSSDFALFEATKRLGGIVETVRRDGFVVECGPDSWVTEKTWAAELARELDLGGEILASQDQNRRTYLLAGNDLVPMPDHMRMMVPGDMNAIADSPLFTESAKRAYREEAGRAEQLRAEAATRPSDFDESVASFVKRHFGDEVTEKIAGPLLAGVFGGDIEKLSAAAVMPGFVNIERERGSLVRAVQEHRHSGNTKSVFTSLKSGLETLIEKMAERIPRAAIRMKEPVLSIARAGEEWRVNTSQAQEQFDAVIVATPVHVARELLCSVDEGFGALLEMRATSAIVVALAFAGAAAEYIRIPRGFGFLVQGQAHREIAQDSLLACTFVDQKFACRVPDGGRLLRAFFGNQAAEALMGEPDEKLTALACSQLSRVLGSLPEPAFSVVRRWPLSLPQYEVGHLQRVARLEAVVGKTHGLKLIGNGYHGVGLPDLVRMGRAAAHEPGNTHRGN